MSSQVKLQVFLAYYECNKCILYCTQPYKPSKGSSVNNTLLIEDVTSQYVKSEALDLAYESATARCHGTARESRDA